MGIFSGLRVIDCASFIAGPGAATVMSDFGADVIKIEPPGNGDLYRSLRFLPGMPTSEIDYGWTLDSRNKRSLALDLKSPEGQSVLARLVAEADVFITNFPPQVRRRLGIGWEALRPLNPRLIYASLSAYGETGPDAERTGFDSVAYWARTGLMDEVKPFADAMPARSVPGQGDHPTAMALYAAIATALYRRERTGEGGAVGTSLLANGMWANGVYIQAHLCGAEFTPRTTREQARNALTNMYRCRDGRWFMLVLLNEDRQWPRLVNAIGLSALLEDARFRDRNARRDAAAALIDILDGVFAARDWPAWRDILEAADVTFGVIGTIAELPDDPQVAAAGLLRRFAGADGSNLPATVDSPFFVDGEVKVTPRRAPGIGEHSREVLREAGFAEQEIQHLTGLGVVA